jgi:peptidyl-prolyl cis-trans isomerase B (cyclophilin B)
MARISRSLIVLTLLISTTFAISTPVASAAISCKKTTAKPHAPLKTNPPMTAAKVLPKTLTLKTNCGDIVIQLDPRAPLTVTEMTALAKAKYFDKSLCHREAVSGFYMLQCGDPTASGSGGPGFTYPDENLPIGAPITYPAGTVAMANSGPATNGSQFFLVYADSGSLPPDYTIWGKITKGIDVLKYIASKGVTGTTGVGAPKIKVAIESTIVK